MHRANSCQRKLMKNQISSTTLTADNSTRTCNSGRTAVAVCVCAKVGRQFCSSFSKFAGENNNCSDSWIFLMKRQN
ncbi:L-asparaginase [Trichinella pseudospiralis]